MLAAHIAGGGRHVTANFDDCIERADPSGWRHEAGLWHFHGSLRADPSGHSLRATLRSIERGFTDDEARRLRSEVERATRLVVLGYSGSDFFDIDPALAAFEPGLLAGHSVLWIAHHTTGSWSARRPKASDPPPVRLLARAGAAVTVLCAPTTEVMVAMTAAWKLSAPRFATGLVSSPTRPSVASLPLIDDRRRATFLLMRQLRLHSAVAELLDDDELPMSSTERFRADADILWERGQFATARRRWWSAPPDVPAWERAERIGACLWEQGRLIPSYVWLRRHARRLDRGSPERLLLAETAGRVVLRMRRSPDTRWLARVLVRSSRAELGTTAQDAGIDMFRRVNDFAAQLDALDELATTAGDVETSREWFLESGDVAAVLAYRHSYLRRTYRRKIPTAELAVEYRALHKAKDLVGSVGARLMLLPGAERIYSMDEFAAGLRESQFAPWHRLRLVASFALRRTRVRLTRHE